MLGEVFGSYRVTAQIGAGGMGVVYLAQHVLMGRKAAVKMILPAFAGNAEIINRFFNEARTTALIRHPGLVDIFDFGYHQNGAAFLVMEYLEGESLSSRIRRDGPMRPDLAVAVTRQVADAVGAAHARGIVHRDLKPENIFLVPEKSAPFGLRVKVLDFGIAKLSSDLGGREGAMPTRTGSMLGTPMYMSPEQCRGAGKVDARSDIYSAGCILFELLAGRTVFLGEGAGDIIASHLREPAPPVRTFAPSIPPELDSLIHAMLIKVPEQRVQTFEEVERALIRIVPQLEEPIAPGRIPHARLEVPLGTIYHPPPGPSPSTVATTLSGLASQVAPVRQPRSGRPLAVAFGALVLAGAGTALFFGGRSASSPAGISATIVPPVQPASSVDSPAKPVVEAKPTEPPPPAAVATAPPSNVPTDLRPATVEATIDSQPPAGVYRVGDGTFVGMTPVTLTVARSSAKQDFVLRHEGYREESIVTVSDRDSRSFVNLFPIVRKTLPETKPAEPKKAPRSKGTLTDPY